MPGLEVSMDETSVYVIDRDGKTIKEFHATTEIVRWLSWFYPGMPSATAWNCRHTVGGMITILSTLVFLLSFCVCSCASLEIEFIAPRHQLTVLRRQRPGQRRLFSTHRFLWAWLYRVWPQVLNAKVLVKPANVVHWCRCHRLKRMEVM
jgi:hypothetical protein